MPVHGGPMAMSPFKRLERDGWHERASYYDDRAGKLTTQVIGHLLNAVQLQPAMKLLDICCGPGYGAAFAERRGATACGIDIAPAMFEEAKRRSPKVEFRGGDAEALDFPDANFDAVICPFGTLHLSAPEQAFAEALRVLRPGRRYAFSVWYAPEKAELLGLALNVIMATADMTVPLPPAPPFCQYSDPVAAKSALEQAGFDNVISEEVPITYQAKQAEEVWDWFEKGTARTMALVRLQTPEVQTLIRDGIVQAAMRYQTGGMISIPCPAVIHSARKPPSL